MNRLINKRGFTFVELIIYISLIGVLVGSSIAIFYSFQNLSLQQEEILKGVKTMNSIDLQLSEDLKNVLKINKEEVEENTIYNIVTTKGNVKYLYDNDILYRNDKKIAEVEDFYIEDITDININKYTLIEINFVERIILNGEKIKELKYEKCFSVPITPISEGGILDEE